MVINPLLFPSVFCLLLSFPLHVWLASAPSSSSSSLVTRMIHRDSVLSPYYNASSTISDRANFALESSKARLSYLSSKSNGGIRGSLYPGPIHNLFYLNLSIGEPPISQPVAMDTGSTLTWVQCVPCRGCPVTGIPIFNPKRSSTYAPVTCHAPECNAGGHLGEHCDSDGYCAYTIRYADKSRSGGVIAYEKFTFRSVSKGSSVASSVLFGCGTENSIHLLGAGGILGLGGDPRISIVSSFGSKFSYCIGNISDPNYTSNLLVLGDGSILDGPSTSFQIRDTLYYVSMVGISVGDTKVPIDPRVFKFNVLIDTGSTLSFLSRSAYDCVKASVENIINGTLEPVIFPSHPDMLCYKGSLEREARGFPTVTFHLDEETDIEMDIENFFLTLNENTFCMAIDVDQDEQNTIGVITQQYYNVGYDLDTMKISFERIDCNVFENSISSIV